MKIVFLSKMLRKCLSYSLLFAAGVSGTVFAANSFDPVGGEHIAVWRPSNGTWYVYNRATGHYLAQQWGQKGDIPAPGDYDNDGTTDFAVYRPSTGYWYIIRSSDGKTESWTWGANGDKPLLSQLGTHHELTVWRPSNGTWYRGFTDGRATITQQWGTSGDVPVPGAYSTSSVAYPSSGCTGLCLNFPATGYGVWRPSNATWYFNFPNGGKTFSRQWGQNGDTAVPEDFNGDGVTDIAIWRPSTGVWWVINSNYWTAPNGGTAQTQQWGQSGDVPVARDYDGDDKADFAVWRPSNGFWYIIDSKTGGVEQYQWGDPTDIPVAYHVAPPLPIIK